MDCITGERAKQSARSFRRRFLVELLQVIIIILLLILSAFFSSAETAYMTVNRVRVESLAKDGNQLAAVVCRILDQYPKMISAILIGNNVVNLAASAMVTVLVTRLFGSAFIGVGTGILTILVLMFGEILPKTIAKIHAERLSFAYAHAILATMIILTPLIFLIDLLSNGILKLLRVDIHARDTMTETELKAYVDISHEDGVIETGEKEIINNVFDFSDTVAKDIMIPRIDMSCVAADADYGEVLKCFRQDMYTRLPVYQDDSDNIIGLINVKDFILVKDRAAFKAADLLRESLYTWEYKKTADLLNEMRAKMQNVAFVVNEYGSTVGMITLEDLLEEIVGEIRDEYDTDEKETIRDLGGGKYLVRASVKLSDLNDAIGTEFASEDYDSIGGMMIEKLERLPRDNESVVLEDGTTLRARGIRQNRILKVLIQTRKKISS
ncbi:MAG: HlyC/CorC family transporter [Lachnospiraceae bacterium]|nr:HlyC/CorC family transporter [Lachnospiraceae bacterium]